MSAAERLPVKAGPVPDRLTIWPVDIVTLTSTAAILVVGNLVAPLIKPDLTYAVYLIWGLPTVAYLTVSSLGSQRKPAVSMRVLEQPAVPQPAATG